MRYMGCSKKLQIKADSKHKTKEWILEFGKALKVQEACPKIQIEKQFLELYWREDLITEAEFMKTAETGDILLFRSFNHSKTVSILSLMRRTQNLPAKLQRSFTGSKYDHVGMVMILDGVVYVLDAQYDSVGLFPFLFTVNCGV